VCTHLLFAWVAGGGRGVPASFLPAWLDGGSCTHLLFAWVAGGGRGVLASFLPGWLEGGLDARLLLPGCLEDGGALSCPQYEDDDGAWGGAGGGVREGGVTYPFPVR
jgi:hypothetical protein